MVRIFSLPQLTMSLVGLCLCLGSVPFKGSSFASGQDDVSETQLSQYVLAQQALAADDFGEAKRALEDLVLITGNDPVLNTVFGPLVLAASAATDIETMRAEFKPLSEYLSTLALPQGFARAYCPMYDGGSNWVQEDGPLRNPYYGSTMLTCGVIDAAPGAHMDHSPRHDGTVFMAPDSFHHIEGTYPEPGIFRLYATDNFREPVDVRLWMGRTVLEEKYDAATDEFLEVVSFALLPGPDGSYLEAEVGELSFPTDITVKLKVMEDFPEDRFDFIFSEYSGSSPEPFVALSAGDPPIAVPLSERIRPEIPVLTADIVEEIGDRDSEILDLVTRGAFTEIFIPALQAKELALALNQRTDQLPRREGIDVRIAVRSLVRAAWLLDWYGDLGNKQQVSGAYSIFEDAVQDITRAYAGQLSR